MKIAVISDIHSNIHALKRVLEDIKSMQVEKIICTGDLVGYLPYPNEVINCFRKHKIESVKGNHDKRIAEHSIDEEDYKKSPKLLQGSASLFYTSKVITDVNRAYLNNLPEKISFQLNGREFLFVHGSPRKIDEYLYEDEVLLKEISEAIKSDVLVFGHTHMPFHKIINHKHFINAGSVGKPKHGNALSTYLILNVKDTEIKSEIRYVKYDFSKLCEEIKDNEMISDQLIQGLMSGR